MVDLGAAHREHDIPLTPDGRLRATAIGKLLAGRRFDRVLSSPMLRARETLGLAGWQTGCALHEGLLEFDYGSSRAHHRADPGGPPRMAALP